MKMNCVEMVRWLFETLDLCPNGEKEVVCLDERAEFVRTPPLDFAMDFRRLEIVVLLEELGAEEDMESATYFWDEGS